MEFFVHAKQNFAAALFFSFFFSLDASAAIRLDAAFAAAQENTEVIRIRESRENQSRAKLSEIKSGVLPSIAFSGTYTRQDPPSSGTSSSSRDPDQKTAKITATQPLFRGLREFAAIRGAKADVRAREAENAQAKLALYASVAQAYYDVLAAERDLQNLKTLEELTRKRVRELTSRMKIGRTRKGEVLAAESQLSTASAQIDAAEAQLELARNRFASETGLPRDSQLVDEDKVSLKLADYNFYSQRLESRPDLQALREQLSSAEEAVRVARGAHFPSVDFSGNYYFKRTGSLDGSKWDAGLTLSLPIFQGGAIQAQVEGAAEKSREAELSLAKTRREAFNSLDSSYKAVSLGIEQVRSLTEAVEAAEKNYREQNREYGYGLVTNLDVIQSLNSFLDIRRSLDRVRYQTLSAWAALAAASNSVPASGDAK